MCVHFLLLKFLALVPLHVTFSSRDSVLFLFHPHFFIPEVLEHFLSDKGLVEQSLVNHPEHGSNIL
jgi:hypothetical protein